MPFQKKAVLLHALCPRALLFQTKKQLGKDAGVDERTALEMRRTGNCTGGSNPSLSAARGLDFKPAPSLFSACQNMKKEKKFFPSSYRRMKKGKFFILCPK